MKFSLEFLDSTCGCNQYPRQNDNIFDIWPRIFRLEICMYSVSLTKKTIYLKFGLEFLDSTCGCNQYPRQNDNTLDIWYRVSRLDICIIQYPRHN